MPRVYRKAAASGTRRVFIAVVVCLIVALLSRGLGFHAANGVTRSGAADANGEVRAQTNALRAQVASLTAEVSANEQMLAAAAMTSSLSAETKANQLLDSAVAAAAALTAMPHAANAAAGTGYDAVHRAKVLAGCGPLCDYSAGKRAPGKYFDELRVPVDCRALFSNAGADAPAIVWPPPKQPPASMQEDYTMGGRVAIQPYYFAQRYSGSDSIKDDTKQQVDRDNVWTKAEIDAQVAQARAGTLPGTYGKEETSNVIAAFREACTAVYAPGMCVQGKHMLVIGSERPWLESVLLAAGARRVTTLEYGRIRSEHPQVSSLLPSELREQFLAGTLDLFDGVATFSSVEHSGLGRYGDTLNPWGDIQAVAKAWCVTKEDGPLYIGVMPVKDGVEMIEWNAHRRYGRARLPHLTANWKQVAKGPNDANVDINFWQPMYLLQRQPAAV
eukprot:g6631.t1